SGQVAALRTIQPIRRRHPDAAFTSGENRADRVTRQTLAYRQARESNVAKSIEAAAGGPPDAALSILEPGLHNVPRQPLLASEPVGRSGVKMREPSTSRSHPEPPVAISE